MVLRMTFRHLAQEIFLRHALSNAVHLGCGTVLCICIIVIHLLHELLDVFHHLRLGHPRFRALLAIEDICLSHIGIVFHQHIFYDVLNLFNRNVGVSLVMWYTFVYNTCCTSSLFLGSVMFRSYKSLFDSHTDFLRIERNFCTVAFNDDHILQIIHSSLITPYIF